MYGKKPKMRGRKPKPTKLKIAAGNPGHRPLNEREPILPRGVGDPPEHLGEKARAEWSRVAAILTEAEVITEGDRAVLALYCSAWDRWVRAEEMLAKSSEILKSGDGGLYQNPYLAISNRALDQVAKLAASLGLDPSSRSRVQTLGPSQPILRISRPKNFNPPPPKNAHG